MRAQGEKETLSNVAFLSHESDSKISQSNCWLTLGQQERMQLSVWKDVNFAFLAPEVLIQPPSCC